RERDADHPWTAERSLHPARGHRGAEGHGRIAEPYGRLHSGGIDGRAADGNVLGDGAPGRGACRAWGAAESAEVTRAQTGRRPWMILTRTTPMAITRSRIIQGRRPV